MTTSMQGTSQDGKTLLLAKNARSRSVQNVRATGTALLSRNMSSIPVPNASRQRLDLP